METIDCTDVGVDQESPREQITTDVLSLMLIGTTAAHGIPC
jgi:hypothetical protein